MVRTCEVEGCGRPHVVHGHCRMHEYRANKHGSYDGNPSRAPHHGPMECDRWLSGAGGGCPHFTDAHVEALVAAGQWPGSPFVMVPRSKP